MKQSGRVVLLKEVRGDFPIGHNTIAPAGVYDAFLNPHGAVAVIAENGQMLGVKPDEFEWLTATPK